MTGHASGQPPEYRKHFVEQARRLADLGAEEEAIARFFGVPVCTIYEWEEALLSSPRLSRKSGARRKLRPSARTPQRLSPTRSGMT